MRALSKHRNGTFFHQIERSITMTDETENPDTATIEPTGEGEAKAEEKKKIKQSVDIKDIGPCKKHITVTVDREAIDVILAKKYKELVGESWIPGFRPGKA